MDSYSKLFKEANQEGLDKLQISIAHKQYCYTTDRKELIDMVNYVAHVGHSHPHVVSAGQEQMNRISANQGFNNNSLKAFSKLLQPLLPASLNQHFLLNSGSEANDLALRMARTYTGGDHFIVFKDAYHGSFSNTLELSPRAARLLGHCLPHTTHSVHTPDLYGGPYREDDPLACDKYVKEVLAAISDIESSGGQLAAFLSEPITVSCGVIVPPPDYYCKVYQLVHNAGGVVIADETGCGLGRAGHHFWTFEHWGVVPDVVTVGKSLGNGFPAAAAITTKAVADRLGDYSSTFGGNPVACSVAKSVLSVVHGEMMVASACSVGQYLLESIQQLQRVYPVLGQVRGKGLCLGIELVQDPTTRLPHPKLTRHIVKSLCEKGCLVWQGGRYDSVLLLTPPLCVTQLDARHFTAALAEVLSTLPSTFVSRKEDAESKYLPPFNSAATPAGDINTNALSSHALPEDVAPTADGIAVSRPSSYAPGTAGDRVTGRCIDSVTDSNDNHNNENYVTVKDEHFSPSHVKETSESSNITSASPASNDDARAASVPESVTVTTNISKTINCDASNIKTEPKSEDNFEISCNSEEKQLTCPVQPESHNISSQIPQPSIKNDEIFPSSQASVDNLQTSTCSIGLPISENKACNTDEIFTERREKKLKLLGNMKR